MPRSATTLVLVLATACAVTPPETPPLPVHLTVGVHEISVQAPAGWEHLDHGLEHRFHRDLCQIFVTDRGPVARDGFLREILRARQLFINDRSDDARTLLADLDLHSSFPDPQRRKEFSIAWKAALDGGHSEKISRSDALRAWNYIVHEVETLGPPDLDLIASETVHALDASAHREEADRQPVSIDGCAGLRVETWDRLSHDHRRSFLLVLNQGHLIVIGMGLGHYAELKPAFETVATSLRFHSSAVTS